MNVFLDLSVTKSRGFISKPLGKTAHHRDQHDQSRVNKVESNRKQMIMG